MLFTCSKGHTFKTPDKTVNCSKCRYEERKQAERRSVRLQDKRQKKICVMCKVNSEEKKLGCCVRCARETFAKHNEI
jgi:hypothetical protein